MTREELESDIINTLFECTHSGEDDTISDKEFAEVLADKFINYETNLLKSFVLFIKDSWAGEIKLWEEQLEISSAFSCERKAIEQKLISMRKMLGLLDSDLETFLEAEE